MSLQKKLITISLILLVIVYAVYEFGTRRPPADWDISGAPTHELRVLQRAIYYIRNNYVGPDRLDTHKMLQNGVESLQQTVAPVMTTWSEDDLILEVAGQKRRFRIPKSLQMQDLPYLLGHILDFIDENLPEKWSDDRDKLEYVILDGVISTLDPHSNFLRPKVYSEFKVGTRGNFGGLGIAVGIREGYLTVIAPLEDTPADRAGLKAGDRIVQVGDERTINMSLTEAVERLRGKVGTKVSLLIRREGAAEPLAFTLRRALISIDSVKAELMKDRVALLKIKNFQEDTAAELMRDIRRMAAKSEGLQGIIIDLRNNPGGLLDQAVAVADAFLADGIIVSTVGFNNQMNEEDHARKNHLLETVPVVVLVNEGSASASEILAGALQVHNRALVIGNRTFGKGTVQTLYDMKDGSALKLTIAKYLAAGTEDVQSYGITPDVALIPVHITEKWIDLVENQVRREHDLDLHLLQEEPKPTKEAAFKLLYLGEEENPDQVTGTISLSRDFPVQLAHTLLTEIDSNNRDNQLEYIKQNIATLSEQQDALIAEKMQAREIDWSVGKNDGNPKGKVSFWVTHSDKTVDELVSGQDIELHLKVENTGDDAFYRLLAVSQSENPFFDNLEFPLGKIEAGQHKDYEVLVSLPASLASQRVPVTLQFHERHGHGPENYEVPISVRNEDVPRFVYEWRINNTDGHVKPGDNVEITFRIENIGAGTTEEPVINLINKEGDLVYLKNGRAKLEPIKPGESAEATLNFRLNKSFKKETAMMDVMIEDRRTGYALSDTLEFSLNGATHNPPMDEWQRPPRLELELPENPLWSDSNHYRLKGKALDDGRIKEIYAFVDLDKIFYQSNRNSPDGDLPFSLKVPLHDGANRITVVAKDDRNLITREQWVVWKP